jgi:translocator protein
MKSLIALVVCAALVAATAFTGAQFEPGDWYERLEKPAWTPADWVFGPVWSALYIAIAVAGWLTWRQAQSVISPAQVVWVLQLVFNASWSWVFFGLNAPALALANIIVLLLLIVVFIVNAGSRLAAVLFMPYALWVAFATALNFEIVRLN